jgi:cation:H+ antiporter
MDTWWMVLYIVGIIAGIAIIAISSDWIADELPALVKRAGLPLAVVSVVGIALATGLPEVLISIGEVAVVGDPYVVVPAMVGSSLMHFLIIGIIAIGVPIIYTRQISAPLIATVAVGSILFAVALIFNAISQIPVIILLVFFGLYIAVAVYIARNETFQVQGRGSGVKGLLGFVGLLVGSLIFILAVDGINVQLALDSSEVGFFMVGFAANLPEFILIGAAAVKAQAGIAAAGALSGNLVNIAFGIGFTGIFSPLPIEGVGMQVAIGGLIFIALITLIMLWTGRRINRYEGIGIVLSYFVIIVIFVLV